MAGSSLRALSQFYGSILSGASAGLSTHDLWSAVQNAAVDMSGSPLAGVSIMDMNVLRGLAGSQLAAAAAFQAAGSDVAIDSNMWANEIDQRSYAQRMAAPQWVVRFENTYVDQNGETGVEWRAAVLSQLPVTKADLLDQLEQEAEQMNDGYGTTSVGNANFMITQR